MRLILLLFSILPAATLWGQERVIPIVDLVSYPDGRRAACPEVTLDGTPSLTTCEAVGVVGKIRIEQGTTFTVCASSAPQARYCENPVLQSRSGRITLEVNGDLFYYLLRDATYGDLGAPMSLFTASKINQVPVRLRFQNWGGKFYVTEVSF